MFLLHKHGISPGSGKTQGKFSPVRIKLFRIRITHNDPVVSAPERDIMNFCQRGAMGMIQLFHSVHPYFKIPVPAGKQNRIFYCPGGFYRNTSVKTASFPVGRVFAEQL